jgi:O-antigen/teichoic acid export membrane protein
MPLVPRKCAATKSGGVYSADNSRAVFRKRHRSPDSKRDQSAVRPMDGSEGASDSIVDEPGPSTPSREREVGERAMMNTIYRSVGEILGRFSSLLLFAAAGRHLGQNGLGAFVFAIAFTGLVMLPVGLGLDRNILRKIAEQRSSADGLFFNVLTLKLALALPLFTLSFLALHLVGYGAQAQATAWVLAPGVFSDSIARSQLAVFSAHERNGPPAAADTINRVCSATLGIVALSLGYGVIWLGITYSIGSIVGVAVGFVLMARTIGVPARTMNRHGWPTLTTSSLPYAAQDVFAALLAKADALILALLATQAAVGIYGAAYRLFESTLFVPYALAGAFAAMYTYLSRDSQPTLGAAYQRSIKSSLVLLTPLFVAFLVLAGPICELVYGPAFAAAAVPLRILAPAVVLIGFVTLTTSLLVSRGNPRRMAHRTGIMVAANIAMNFILIPIYGVGGAAAAMLATEAIFALWIVRPAVREVGDIRWLPTVIGSLAGGTAMAAVTLALRHSLPAALLAGVAVYLLVVLAVEWLVSPRDVIFVAGMLRRRISSRPAT